MKAVSSAGEGLPAQLSAREGDRYYDDRAVGLSDRIEVLLDGTVLDEVTSYDVVKGVVVRHCRGVSGKLVLERGAPTFETLRGKVEVRWSGTQGGAA